MTALEEYELEKKARGITDLVRGSLIAKADAAIAELQAEVERMKEFCYECKHLDGWAWCRESGLTEQRGQRDHCLFTPSRWERREP